MFSKKAVILLGLIALFVVSIVALTVSSRMHPTSHGIGQGGIAMVGPFQQAFTQSVRFVRGLWEHYFFLVTVAHENEELRRELARSQEMNHRYRELEMANQRLRKLLHFRETIPRQVLSAQVIGKDPSPWFKTVMIDKGRADGVDVGYPVVVPEGVVGQVTDASAHYAKVLLIIDKNNAVDGLVQRTRARGIIQGAAEGRCTFKYALRKHDIQVGDTVISSGLDGVFPKGLRVGRVLEVIKRDAGIFQEIEVVPFVDFETLEEVLVVLNMPAREYGAHP